MKVEFIGDHSKNTRLILIFTGWSTNATLYSRISMPGWDVAVVFDYTDLDLNLDFITGYYTIYLFAWSMGVWAASKILPPQSITSAFAINGSPTPACDNEGIPLDIFKGTADNLTPRNLIKFRRRMVKDSTTMDTIFPGTPTEQETISLRNQLYFILSESCGGQPTPFPWTRAYIGRNDRIFPIENMRKAWNKDPDTIVTETDEYHYMDMEKVIRSIISDTFKISGRFSKAGVTYDSQAFAQQITASRLADMLRRHLDYNVDNMLEIGPGTGCLTHYCSQFLKPAHADFVDITDVGPFHIASSEDYHIEDAEVWISGVKRRYDLIVSASAIQWFADIPRFLDNCARLLTPGKLIGLSTFLPGNLCELDSLRQTPLMYRSEDWFRKVLQPNFDILIIDNDKIIMEFESSRHALLHLKHTGVAGSGSDGGRPFSSMTQLRKLTYKPLYILARRKSF